MKNCIVKVSCDNCHRKWEIYWQDIKNNGSNKCPHCGKEIDWTLWERDITRAAASVLDANMELERDATGYNKTGFSIDVIYKEEKAKGKIRQWLGILK